MPHKIIYNNGESIEETDFNLQQDLMRRFAFDELLWSVAAAEEYPGFADSTLNAQVWNPGTEYGTLIRPHRHAGVIQRLSASSIRVSGGFFVQLSTTALSDDDHVGLVAAAPAATDITGISAASAGTYRRDLVEARLVWNDAPDESRDFKDAITGALSSQNITKRSDLQVEFQIHTGTEGTLAASANAGNLIAATAGWQVIGAILVDDTGVVTAERHIWDYRRPWGSWRAFVGMEQMLPDSGWTRGSDSNGLYYGATVASNLLLVPLLQAGIMPANTTFGSKTWDSIRIGRISLLADYGASPSSDIYLLSRRHIFDDFQVSNVGIDAIPGSASDASDGDVSGRVSSAAAEHVIYEPDNSYPEDPPLWINGVPSPQYSLSELPPRLWLSCQSTGTGTDKVYGVELSGWGGV